MDIWIRSQKGRLTQIVDVSEPILDEWEKTEGYCLYGYSSCQIRVPLAMYKTKERALEILDEMQNLLTEKYCVNLSFKDAFKYGFTQYQVSKILRQLAVYDMPKE